MTDFKVDRNVEIFQKAVEKLALRFPIAEISKKLDYGKGNVSNFLKGKKAVPNDFLDNFFKTFNISKEEIENELSEQPQQLISKSDVHIPYYNVDFAGGWSSEEMFANHQPDFFINNPEFERCDFACNLVGKSVSKIIPDNSIVGFRIIDDLKTYFPQNELYGIITKNDFRTVKLISKTKDGKTLILKPQPSEEFLERYKDQEEPIPVEFVTKFLQVMAYACFERIAM